MVISSVMNQKKDFKINSKTLLLTFISGIFDYTVIKKNIL